MREKVNKTLLFIEENVLFVLSVGFLLAFIAIHLIWYIHPSEVASLEELETLLTDGQPTLVNFYSNL